MVDTPTLSSHRAAAFGSTLACSAASGKSTNLWKLELIEAFVLCELLPGLDAEEALSFSSFIYQ
jgi:hypothetical protein